MIAPITLTYADGTKIALSRVGDVVTAVATGGSTGNGAAQAIPAGYSPAGNVSSYVFNANVISTATWALIIDELGALNQVGIATIPVGAYVPGTSFTTQWLADPLPGGQSSGDDLEEFYVHTVLVETYQGTNGYGEDKFASSVAVAGFLDDSRKLIRSLTGEQVISESQFYTHPENGALFTADSRVTVDGVVSRVIRTNVNTSGDLDLPDHAVVSLT